jgi:hypothetical protein
MVYAGGRPLWQLSLSYHDVATGQPAPVLRWSPTKWRKAEALRDRIMRGVGTDEPWVTGEMSKQCGELAVAVHYRRPLRIDEVARMTQTEEVRARLGRP